MLILLHYLPFILFAALALLAIAVVFGDDDKARRAHAERSRNHHYAWNDRTSHRD